MIIFPIRHLPSAKVAGGRGGGEILNEIPIPQFLGNKIPLERVLCNKHTIDLILETSENRRQNLTKAATQS